MSETPTIFISWAHEGTPELKGQVLALANRLNNEGFQTTVDLYVGTTGPSEGWALWCERQVTQSQFVIVICSPTCKRRYDGEEKSGVGLGACFEAKFARDDVYASQGHNPRYIPVMLRESDSGSIPRLLSQANRYELWKDDGYGRLYRHLCNIPEFERPPLGKIRALAPLPPRQQETSPRQPTEAPAAQTSPPTDTPLDREINAIMAIAQGGKHLKARQMLEDILALREDQLDDRLRFRVLANLGTIRAADGDSKAGAELFRQAYSLQRERRRAQELLAAAYQLDGDQAAAFTLASSLCAEQPEEPFAQSVRVRTAPPAMSFAELEETIPLSLRDDRQVLLALFNRSGELEDIAASIRYAERMVAAAPDDPNTHLSLGSVLLQAVLIDLKGDLSLTPTAAERDRLLQADTALRKAESLWGTRDKNVQLASLYRNRATLQRFLGNLQAALANARQAYELAPEDADCVLGYALELDFQGDDRTALSIIEKALGSAPSHRARLLMAVKLHERGKPGDAAIAANALFDGLRDRSAMDELPAAYREDWTYILVSLLCELKDLARARDILAVAKHIGLDDGAVCLLEAMVESVAGDSKAAATSLDRALALASGQWDSVRLQRLCEALQREDRYGDALRVYRLFCRTDRLTAYTRAMLHCAQKAGEDAFVMATLLDLRKAGQTDSRLLQIEAQLCFRYREFERMAEALKAGIQSAPNDIEWRVQLAHLAFERGRPDWMPEGLDDLPTANTVSLDLGCDIAALLIRQERRKEAARYAYTLSRRFPGQPRPAAVLIGAVLMPGRAADAFGEPERAKPGVAIRYEWVQGGPPQVAVIEDDDGPAPDADRHEYGPNHALSQALMNRKVGEEFDEPSASLTRRCRIVSLVDKCVYRANVLASSWRQRHPDIPFVEDYRPGDITKIKDDPKAALGEMYEQLSLQEGAIEHFDAAYKDGAAPLPMIAKRMGRGLLETVLHMAQESSIGVSCCIGTAEERARALQEVRTVGRSNGYVVEPTALATLFIIEGIDLLERLPAKPSVSESTLEDVRGAAITPSNADGESIRIGISGGKLWHHVIDADGVAKWNQRVEKFVSDVRERCHVIGGGSLAELPVKERDRLQKWFPSGTAESIAIAFARGSVLWSDDRWIGSLMRGQWGRASAWTMAVCLALEELGVLDSKRVAGIGLKLMECNYRFIGVSPLMVTERLKKDMWDPGAPATEKLLAQVVAKGWPWRRAAEFVAAVLKGIWMEAPSREAAKGVTAVILRSLGGHADAERIRRALEASAVPLMGLDVIGGHQLKEQIRRAQEGSGPSGGLIVP